MPSRYNGWQGSFFTADLVKDPPSHKCQDSFFLYRWNWGSPASVNQESSGANFPAQVLFWKALPREPISAVKLIPSWKKEFSFWYVGAKIISFLILIVAMWLPFCRDSTLMVPNWINFHNVGAKMISFYNLVEPKQLLFCPDGANISSFLPWWCQDDLCFAISVPKWLPFYPESANLTSFVKVLL